ncbi:MAG: DUF3237 domain-containing protein [Deltaproteobacteria bacterium]|nr:DUF3237 domain-containing protein [Deltaproteobacteria bacterium]
MLEMKSKYLCEVVANLDEPQIVGETPSGIRMIFPITGGYCKGEEVSGEILPVGADWFLLRPDGIGELDVRATLRTNDDALIYTYYRGVIDATSEIFEKAQMGETVDPSEYYFRTTPVFETGSEKYNWISKIICVGVGEMGKNQVRYKIYQVL